MMSFAPKRRMGWLPDYPDFRDYTADTEAIQDLLHPESAATSDTSRQNANFKDLTPHRNGSPMP